MRDASVCLPAEKWGPPGMHRSRQNQLRKGVGLLIVLIAPAA